jgi:hypothetical protein
MGCAKKGEGKKRFEPIIFNDMPANNIFDNISGNIQVGKRQDLFWVILAGLATSVLIISQVFKRKKRR